MTANAFQDDVRDCIDAGMNAHIAKPIDSKKIEDTLQQVLKQKIQYDNFDCQKRKKNDE